MSARKSRRLVEDVEKSHQVRMSQRRDHVVLMRTYAAIDKSKQMVASSIKKEQKLTQKNFEVKLHQAKLRHANIMGDREMMKELRLEKESPLNTEICKEDNGVLTAIWRHGARQMALQSDGRGRTPGIDSRCISAVRLVNRKAQIQLPEEKAVTFNEDSNRDGPKRKDRPSSTVSIVKPSRTSRRPATAIELSSIRKALNLSSPDVAETRGRESEGTDDHTGGYFIRRDNSQASIRRRIGASDNVSLDEYNNNVELEDNVFLDNETDNPVKKRDRCISYGTESDDKHSEGFGSNSDHNQYSGTHNRSRQLHGAEDMTEAEHHPANRRLRVKHNNFLGFVRPKTAPHTVTYNLGHKKPPRRPETAIIKVTCKKKDTESTNSEFKMELTADSSRLRSKTRSHRPLIQMTPRSLNHPTNEDNSTLLEIHKRAANLANYEGRIKAFTTKVIPLNSVVKDITDYYISPRHQDESSTTPRQACAVRLTTRSPEVDKIETKRPAYVRSLTLKEINLDFNDLSNKSCTLVNGCQ